MSLTDVDYSSKIPNNVGLAEDRRILRALEGWYPGYLDWWQNMGPEGFQEAMVYLRTAVSVDAKGWAKFDYVRMPEYRWGILLAAQEEDRKIPFGRHLGEPAWQDVPGEYRAMLRRLIVIQGDTEPASVEQQRHLGKTAPSLYDMRNLFQVNVEEGRHLWAMVYLLHKYFGRDGREEADDLLRRRSGSTDAPRMLGAFNEQTPDWLVPGFRWRSIRATLASRFSHPRPEPRSRPLLRNHHILELARLVVDPHLGRRDPAGELAGLLHRLHQLGDELAVRLRGQPLILLPFPGGGIDQFAQRGGAHVAELANGAVERHVGKLEVEIDAAARDDLVPAFHTLGAVDRVVVAQAHVERGQRRLIDEPDIAVHQLEHGIGRVLQPVIVFDLGLAVAALEARIEGVRRVGRNFGAEQVERQSVVQIELLLERRQVDDAERTHARDIGGVVDAGCLHRLAGALDGAADPGFAHEHVVGLLGQHEAARARKRIEA